MADEGKTGNEPITLCLTHETWSTIEGDCAHGSYYSYCEMVPGVMLCPKEADDAER